jgi:hypothetical protein
VQTQENWELYQGTQQGRAFLNTYENELRDPKKKSGKLAFQDCKTFIHRFDSDRRLQV